MAKIFSVIFIFFLAFSTEVFSQSSNKTVISSNSQTTNAASNTKTFIQNINSNGVTVSVYNLNGFFFVNDVPIGNSILTSTVNGVYYINGMPITNYVNYYNNSINNGSYSLNNPIWSGQSGCTVQSNDGKISTTQCFQNSNGTNAIASNSNAILSSNNGVDSAAIYLQALAEFSLKDYKSALKDCNTALLSNPHHAQAIVLRTVIQALQNEKITEEEAQSYIAGPQKSAGNL